MKIDLKIEDIGVKTLSEKWLKIDSFVLSTVSGIVCYVGQLRLYEIRGWKFWIDRLMCNSGVNSCQKRKSFGKILHKSMNGEF